MEEHLKLGDKNSFVSIMDSDSDDDDDVPLAQSYASVLAESRAAKSNKTPSELPSEPSAAASAIPNPVAQAEAAVVVYDADGNLTTEPVILMEAVEKENTKKKSPAKKQKRQTATSRKKQAPTEEVAAAEDCILFGEDGEEVSSLQQLLLQLLQHL